MRNRSAPHGFTTYLARASLTCTGALWLESSLANSGHHCCRTKKGELVMYSRRFAAVLGILGLGIALTTATVGRTQQDPAPPPPPVAGDQQQDQTEGTEVLARGPIHEAFADPVNNKPQPTAVVPKEPPPAIEELPPDQKPAGENVQWFPGYWSWDDDRNDFIWVSGMWRTAPPDRNWAPGHWNQVNGGYQRTPGFWMAVQGGEEGQ